MDVDEVQARMQEIQRIMECATLFTLLPGTPAVVGGLLVLAGCAVSYAMFRSLDFADILHLSFGGQVAFCVMWFAIGVIGVLLEVILTTVRGRPAAPRADRSSHAGRRILANAKRRRGHGIDAQVPHPCGTEGRGDPLHRARLDDALRHGGLHCGLVLRPAASRPGLDVSRLGDRRPVVLPGIRRPFGGAVLRIAPYRFWYLHLATTAADGGLMTEPIKPDDLDAVIHERVRLAIVAALAVSPQLSFNELKSMLALTDGNLSAHSRTLDEAGYIVVEKSFRGRRPYTAMRLTLKGRKAFERYLGTLRQIVPPRNPSGRGLVMSAVQRDQIGLFFWKETLYCKALCRYRGERNHATLVERSGSDPRGEATRPSELRERRIEVPLFGLCVVMLVLALVTAPCLALMPDFATKTLRRCSGWRPR